MSNGISQSVKNDKYIRDFVKTVKSIPSQVLAAASIAGFKAAVRHTYMDSGQFALNWQIKVGARARFVPEIQYRTRVGQYRRGDKRTDKGESDKIFSVVMSREGLPESPYAHYSSSDLYRRISRSRAKTVRISNPFWDSKYGSEVYVRGGRNGYPANAVGRPGHLVNKYIQQAATRAAHTTLKRLEKEK